MGFEEFREKVRERLKEIMSRFNIDFDHYEKLSPHYSPAYVVYMCSKGDESKIELAVASMLFRYGVIALDSAIDEDIEKDRVPTPYALRGRKAIAEGLVLIGEAIRLHPNFAILLRDLFLGLIPDKEDVYLKTSFPNVFTCREASGDEAIVKLWEDVGFVQQLYDDYIDGDDYSYYYEKACESWKRVKDSVLSSYMERYRDVVERLCK